MGIMIFMLKSQRRAFRWPNNLRARLYSFRGIERGRQRYRFREIEKEGEREREKREGEI